MEGTIYAWCTNCGTRTNVAEMHRIPEFNMILCLRNGCWNIYKYLGAKNEQRGE